MSPIPEQPRLRGPRPSRALFVLCAAVLLQCSSSSPSSRGPTSVDAGDASNTGDDDDDGGGPGVTSCFPDSDGITGGSYTIALTVDDTGFSKTVLNTQNDATVTLTLTNNGTMAHGFEVGCVDVTSAFPDLPAGCPTTACFPASSMIAPIGPGASATVTFFTPTPDGVIYPFQSSAPGDASVPGLNNGQWSLM